MQPISEDGVVRLVTLLGREGAVSGLEHSTQVTREHLVALANSLGLELGRKENKKEIAAQIIRHVDKRITKSLDELKKMTKQDLIQYFHEVECDQEELVDLLNSIDLRSRAMSRKALIEFASIQVSSLGVFERVAE